MTQQQSPVPVVMVFSGNDPSGGAGVQADIESLISHGCHTAPVITALTIQDTQDVIGYTPLDGGLVMEQARAVLEDMPIHAIKLGLLTSTDAVEAIHSVLSDYPDIPVVMEPSTTPSKRVSLPSSIREITVRKRALRSAFPSRSINNFRILPAAASMSGNWISPMRE